MSHCTICDIHLNSVDQLTQHKTGKTHLKNLAIKNGDIPTPGLGSSKPASSSPSSKYVIGNPTQHIMFVKAGLMSEQEAVQAKETVKRQAGEEVGETNSKQMKKSTPGKNANKRMQPNYCDYCKKHMNSSSQSSQHYSSEKHRKKVRLVEGGTGNREVMENGRCLAQTANKGAVPTNTPGYNPAFSSSLHYPPTQGYNPAYNSTLQCPAPPPPPPCLANINKIPPLSRLDNHSQPAVASLAQPSQPPLSRLDNHSQPVVASIGQSSQPTQHRLDNHSQPVVASIAQSSQPAHGSLYCSFCKMMLNSVSQIAAHRAGAKHKKNVARLHQQAFVS